MSKHIIVTIENNIQLIKLNKPKKKNAIDVAMYIQLTNILADVATNENIVAIVVTGEGDFFSSGNDMSPQNTSGMYDMDPQSTRLCAVKIFVEALINFPKLLIAIVNGPAIGIAATTLPLFDVVLASEKAFFSTPFTKLAVCAEACSSYTFPKILGKLKAAEMLIFGQKLTSSEALKYGFVNEVFKDEEIQIKAWKKIREYASLSPESMLATRNLMRLAEKDNLLLANNREFEELNRRMVSEEFTSRLEMFIPRSKI